MKFYLGTHRPHWLGYTDVPLFVSHRRLVAYKTLPRAMHDWALDSGAFTEITRHGRWTITPAEYAWHVRRYVQEVGRLQWAAPQDWMCEDFVLRRTGLSVAEHQQRTTDNYLELRDLASDLPFIPVLQGYRPDEYHRHVDAYDRAGVDLTREPLVGIGSVCKRQSTAEMGTILAGLTPIRLHGFGVKTTGLSLFKDMFCSADSMAWSYDGRMPQGGSCSPPHKYEQNCRAYALSWRRSLLRRCLID